jgi:hypothetical protein
VSATVNTVSIPNRPAAMRFLDGFDRVTARRGNSLFEGGAVRELVGEASGSKFTGVVEVGAAYVVTLVYEEGGWRAGCTCPPQEGCKHAYAVMKALLNGCAVDHPTEAPRGSHGSSASPAPKGTLMERVTEALGRTLRPNEAAYVKRVQDMYRQARRTGTISGWELHGLGLTSAAFSWEQAALWPLFPRNDIEFWLYVAHAMVQGKLQIPAFMAPATDFDLIRPQLVRWQREKEIGRWRQRLEETLSSAARNQAPRLDLRLRLSGTTACLEQKWEREAEFTRMKAGSFRTVVGEYMSGSLELEPEAFPIWHAFNTQWQYGGEPERKIGDSDMQRLLNHLLRMPSLRPRLVGDDGAPLARPAEPLGWRLIPPEDAAGDYRIQLTLPNGEAPPPILAALPGHPPLYLCGRTVYAGPPPVQGLETAQAHVIPAPALETRSGLALLQRLELPPPARLAERVRHIPLPITMRCKLSPLYPGSPSEGLFVEVEARSPDGDVHERFHGNGWGPIPTAVPRKPPERDGLIYLLDRSLQRHFPALLAPLNFTYDWSVAAWRLRVQKNLPERLAAWLASIPKDIRVELDGELDSFSRDPVKASLELDCVEAGVDWFDLRVLVKAADTDLGAEELKVLLNARGGYVRLRGKGWRRLEFDITGEQDESLARLGLSPRDFSSEPQRLHALQLSDQAAAQLLPAVQVEQVRRRVEELKTRVLPPLPETIKAQLRPYQVEGFHFLAYLTANRFGGILADDMGLGKTLQTLTWLAWLKSQPDAAGRPSLVVCPKSVMENWHGEAARFFPTLRVRLWHGTDAAGLPDAVAEADLLVVNYAQLRILALPLAGVSWLAAILDEGQFIKNPATTTANAVRALRADQRLVLSGTPIENRLMDLWSLMGFAMPGILGNRTLFNQRYNQADDPLARRRLSSRVRPFLLRRTKGQVAKDLPDRVEEDLYCEMEPQQAVLYRAEYKHARQMLLNVKTQQQLNEFRFHFLTSLLRLRQICCHPSLYAPDSPVAPSAKLNAIVELLEPLMEEGHKVLVFSQFVSMLAILKETLDARGWPYFYLAGETEDRGAVVSAFQSAEGAAVFLLSLKAGGFGLNLTAASYVVLFDPWWNPAVENQAIDRTHRIGQVNKVIAYRLLIKESIEEKIRVLQRQKRALAQDVLGEESFAKALTLEDLQFLFAEEG